MLASLYSPAVKAYMFQQFLTTEAGPDWASLLGGPVLPSNQPIETYGGVGTVPMLRPWRGTRRASEPRPITFTLPNERYEGTLVVTPDDLSFNKLGHVQANIDGLAKRASQHWRKLISDVITANTVGYDGLAMFHDSHVENGQAAQDNNLAFAAATGTTPTVGEMEGAILQAMAALMGFKDDNGEPVNEDLNSLIVMVPTAHYNTAAGALSAPVIADAAATGGRTNIVATMGGKSFTLVGNPRITGDVMYLFVANGRSFIRQEVEQLKITAKAEGSDYEHDTGGHEYGVGVLRAAGPGDWKGAVKTTFT